eukprot:gnl/TRDRNA2_/TRDRNA2_128503_c0_seq3.p1 gnl/TRDRNA2_/TRDRNA2_128503_c0~~gnl/TRDRNA2_/TRDRNA2_128503_c0_seq3.p1  ORF type:complete len:219 (+),score=28.06 gnl/TRDRNA2_/TRDRNA2_128503_c0_seq3:69-725(+)
MASPPPDIVGDVAARAAQDPRVQAAAKDAAKSAAQDAARQAASNARMGFFEVRTYVQESNCSVKIVCFISGLILFGSSILGIINIFGAVFKPHQYITALYNCAFAIAIIICEGKPEWWVRCFDVQMKLFAMAAFLASRTGRALFYLYIGTINIFLLPDNDFWKFLHIAVGALLVICSLLMLAMRWGCIPKKQNEAEIEGGYRGDGGANTGYQGETARL